MMIDDSWSTALAAVTATHAHRRDLPRHTTPKRELEKPPLQHVYCAPFDSTGSSMSLIVTKSATMTWHAFDSTMGSKYHKLNRRMRSYSELSLARVCMMSHVHVEHEHV